MVTLANFQIALGLQLLRESHGMSADDLSEIAGLPPGEVDRIEAGEVVLDYLTAARLTTAMEVGLAEIAVAAHRLDPALVRSRYEHSARCMGSLHWCDVDRANGGYG